MSRLIHRTRKLTLTLNISELSPMEVTDAEIAQGIEEVMRDWNEGRYPQHVEMVHYGIGRVIEAAIRCAMHNKMKVKYGDEMLKTDDGGYCQKAGIMAGLATRGVYVEAGNADSGFDSLPQVTTIHAGAKPYWSDRWDHLNDS